MISFILKTFLIFTFFLVVIPFVITIYNDKVQRSHTCEDKGGQYVMTYNLHHKCLDVRELR